MIARVTFLVLRHRMDWWYSCRANRVSSRSNALRSAECCPITWRTTSRQSSEFGSRSTFRTVITARPYMMDCGISCFCWATKRLSNCRRVSAGDCTGVCRGERRLCYLKPSSIVHRRSRCKGAPDFRGKKVHQQRASDHKTDATSNQVAPQAIDEIPQALCCENNNSEYPAPMTASEPPYTRGDHHCA